MRTVKTVWLQWAQYVLKSQSKNNPHFSPSRRQFIQNTTKSAIACTFIPNLKILSGTNKPRIAIVGGGLAGLTCAWRLKKAGLDATVYEASDRVGGRTHTIHGFQKEGSSCEIGGEYFSSGHRDMVHLARELSLKIKIASSTNRHLKPFKAFFDNREIPLDELEQSLLSLREKLAMDIADLPEWVTWENADQFIHLDNMSVAEYLKSKGADDLCYHFLCKAFTMEYGMEASKLSAINLLLAFKGGFAYSPSSKLKSLQISEGNQSICEELSSRMWNTVQLNHKLVNLHQHTNWYTLSFKIGGQVKTIEADYVVLALPFSVLKNIESDIHFPDRKQQAINELGYGQKDSLLLGFNKKTWREQGYDGLTFSDELFGYGSDHLPKNKGVNHVLSINPCGDEATKFLKMSTADAAMKSLHSLNKIYPGIYQHFDGQALKFCWSDYQHSMGSNSCYKVGQYSQFGGEEGKSVENVFFAGEHCSHNFKGTMNGAVETGNLVARNLARRIQRKVSRALP